MAVDYPDGTLPIGITANYIGNLPVNITAQTIATLSIDIITMPNVTIGTWAAGTLTIQGSVAVTTMPSVTIGVWSAGTLVVSGSVAVTSIPTVTIGTWSAGTLVISGSVVVTSIPTVTIGVWSAGTLTIDGSVIVSSMPAVTIGTWNAGTLTVNINTMPSVTIATWSAGTLTVSVATLPNITIGTWSAGTLNVSIASAVAITIGTWSAGTLSIDITAATIGALNIKTSGGINIILDKLTTDAYTERRSNPSNQGAVASWAYQTGVSRDGKRFPRGCRGFLIAVTVYCKDVGVSGGTITIYVSPYPGIAAVASANVTVPAGGAEANRNATFNIPWNYDSMFLSVKCSSTDIVYAYDTGTPYDYYSSGDSGATWATGNFRIWAVPNLAGETCGDVPVSGTVNNIEIPNLGAARQLQVLTDIPAGTEVYDTIQYGSGRCLVVFFAVLDADAKDYLRCRIKCDGVQVMPVDGTLDAWYNYWVTASSPGIAIGQWNTTIHHYTLIVTTRFPFKRSLEVGFYNGDVNPQTGRVAYSYEKIS